MTSANIQKSGWTNQSTEDVTTKSKEHTFKFVTRAALVESRTSVSHLFLEAGMWLSTSLSHLRKSCLLSESFLDSGLTVTIIEKGEKPCKEPQKPFFSLFFSLPVSS